MLLKDVVKLFSFPASWKSSRFLRPKSYSTLPQFRKPPCALKKTRTNRPRERVIFLTVRPRTPFHARPVVSFRLRLVLSFILCHFPPPTTFSHHKFDEIKCCVRWNSTAVVRFRLKFHTHFWRSVFYHLPIENT